MVYFWVFINACVVGCSVWTPLARDVDDSNRFELNHWVKFTCFLASSGCEGTSSLMQYCKYYPEFEGWKLCLSLGCGRASTAGVTAAVLPSPTDIPLPPEWWTAKEIWVKSCVLWDGGELCYCRQQGALGAWSCTPTWKALPSQSSLPVGLGVPQEGGVMEQGLVPVLSSSRLGEVPEQPRNRIEDMKHLQRGMWERKPGSQRILDVLFSILPLNPFRKNQTEPVVQFSIIWACRTVQQTELNQSHCPSPAQKGQWVFSKPRWAPPPPYGGCHEHSPFIEGSWEKAVGRQQKKQKEIILKVPQRWMLSECGFYPSSSFFKSSFYSLRLKKKSPSGFLLERNTTKSPPPSQRNQLYKYFHFISFFFFFFPPNYW